MNKNQSYRKRATILGSTMLVFAMLANLIVPAVFAQSDITAVAKYDMKTAKNLLDGSRFALLGASLKKDSDAPYSDVYRTDTTAGASINGLASELGYDFVIDTWFKSASASGEQRIVSIADSKNMYYDIENGSSYIIARVLYTHDNGDGTFSDKRVGYKPSSTSNQAWAVKSGQWNHIVFAMNSEDKMPVVYINNNPIDFVRTDEADISEYELKTVSDSAVVYLNRTANLNNVQTNGLTYNTWGGGFSRFRFSDTVIYSGAADEETLQKIAQPNDKFDVIYDMVLSQAGEDISLEDLKNIKESSPFYAKISNIDSATAEEGSIYLKNDNDEKILGTVTETGARDITIKYAPAPGEYTLVVENSVQNYNGSRKSNYNLNLKVNEDQKFREDLRKEIGDSAASAEEDPEAFLNVIKKYSEYLNISFDDFDRCIGKNNVLINLAKKINDNPNYEFSDIAVWFSEFSVEQSSVDFVDAVKLINVEFAKAELSQTDIEALIFGSYASCFSVSEVTKTLYNSLKNKNNVWNKFKGKSYDTKPDTIKAEIEEINKDIDAAVSGEDKAEFYDEFNSCAAEQTEEYLKKAIEEYGLEFDLNDKEYIAYKDAVCAQINESSFTAENAQSKIQRCMAAVLLSKVESGNRDKVGEILEKYKNYIAIPEKYTSSVEKISYQKKMIGKVYKEANIEEKLQEAIKEADNEAASKPSGGGGGGGTGSSGTNRNNTYSGTASGGNTTIPPTSEIRPANKDKEMYIDIADFEWAKEAIEALGKKKIIEGKEDGIFAPADDVLREEMVKMAVLAFDIAQTDNKIDFSDVSESDWSYKYITGAVAAGVIQGISETEFGKGKPISRADSAVIISRIIENKNLKMKAAPEATEFADYGNVPEYAKEAVDKMQKYGIMNGMDNNMFMPRENVTRAQMAQIIYNALKNIEE